ncbi:MAG: glycoside hydrolase family 3 N-terminal domain-containing protein [Pseudoruegeria sp.]
MDSTSTAYSPTARLLARQVQRGQVGSVYFVAQNISTPKNFAKLVKLFRRGPYEPLLAIDHEGGLVQRLGVDHGLTPLPKARDVAASLSPKEATTLYTTAGQELAKQGFNVNLGPVLDVDRIGNPAIGAYGRAYHTRPAQIATYGEAFVAGFSSAGILYAAKHFPGHGKSVGDSHETAADISSTWTEKELEPFARLIVSQHPPSVIMMGHLRLESVALDGMPATLSASIVTGLLREKLKYDGVVVTDDLDMNAISDLMDR